MHNPIVMHSNCAEQETLQEMCRLAAAWGYEGVEFRAKPNKDGQGNEQYLDEIARAVEQSRLKHVLFGGGPNLMSPDADARRRDIDLYASFYRAAAKRFALTVCNTFAGTLVAPDTEYMDFDQNGSTIATEEQWQWAVTGFRELDDVAAELGFRLAFETHNCYIHDLPECARRLVDLIGRPSVGINFDFGNIVLNAKHAPLGEALRICRERIYEVHLKNVYLVPGVKYRNFVPCPLSDGVINHREYLAFLKSIGYQGPITIETPRDGDRRWFAREDLRYLKLLIEEMA